MEILPPPNILIVDENTNSSTDLNSVLNTLDVEFVLSTSGLEAVELVMKTDFAFIIIDIESSGGSGFETAEMIRRIEGEKSIPIIFLTDDTQSPTVKFDGFKNGAVDFVIKPIDAEILQSKISVFLEVYRTKCELHVSNKAFHEFARLASHDLRAPLRQASCLAGMILDDYDNQNREGVVDLINLMKTTHKRMDDYIDSLLSYAELDAKVPEYSLVQINELLQGILEDFTPVIQEFDIEIKIGALPEIECSEFHLRQALQNIVSNAIKYRKDVTPLVIEIDSTRDEANNACRITFKDNGIGFDPKDAENIFKPFVRCVGASKFEGSGVGLATVRKAISLHRGTVGAQSVLGEGAVFTVEIPIVRAA